MIYLLLLETTKDSRVAIFRESDQWRLWAGSVHMPGRFSRVWLFVTPRTLFVGFSRQEYWSGLPCPPPRDLPSPEIEPGSFMSLAVSGGFFTIRATEEGEEIVSSSHLCIFDGASSLPDGDEILHWSYYYRHTLQIRDTLNWVATPFGILRIWGQFLELPFAIIKCQCGCC